MAAEPGRFSDGDLGVDHPLGYAAKARQEAAAVTVPSAGLAEAPGSKVTSAGTRRGRSHCRAGSGGAHRGCGDSYTGGDDVPTSCRKSSALNAALRRPWELPPRPNVDGALVGAVIGRGAVYPAQLPA